MTTIAAPTASTSRPVVLIILDGWGVTEDYEANAVTKAEPSFFDYLLRTYPSTLLQASGQSVGLPFGEIGNSEVGHFTIGCGRIVKQNLYRINYDIETQKFFQNQALLKSIEHAKANKSSLHLMGLLGSGGVHASQEHLYALLELCKINKFKNVFIHLFLDGRDSPKDSAAIFMKELQHRMKKTKVGKIATMGGRFFGMDRNNTWDRIAKAYNAITKGEANETTEKPLEKLQEFYQKEIYDEQIEPVVVTHRGRPVATVEDNDSVVFFNYRSDRARQITSAFIDDDFVEFKRDKIKNLQFTSFTKYSSDLKTEIAFPREEVKTYLGQTISDHGLKQLHVAETEKYAHVTFFFNALREDPLPGEQRILVPSPVVESYDLLPQMSSFEVTEKLMEQIKSNIFNFYLINYANSDMVAHTGNMQASVAAVKSIDENLKNLIALIRQKKGVAIITADHGNVEELANRISGDIDKEHSTYPVPFILVDDNLKNEVAPCSNLDLFSKPVTGVLADIAPTILSYFNLSPSDEMTGVDLRRVM
ncbi:2,3-bisphosphoglycerate-independent phosphoglycerate mutase [Patescibacteria group bacterium]|nr:2,3-bisphosphoglycerate-independent phosphoglycerate mutase [Patescibacteria group bacterium]